MYLARGSIPHSESVVVRPTDDAVTTQLETGHLQTKEESKEREREGGRQAEQKRNFHQKAVFIYVFVNYNVH